MTSTAAPPIPAPARPAPRARRSRGKWRGWMFVAPFMLVFALTFIAPVVYAFVLSLFRDQAFFGGTVFVGADNYVQVFGDPKFWEAFRRVLVFLAVQVPIMLVLALIAALAIDSARRGRRADVGLHLR
jgi:multiple sugar transport system permease protein